MSFAPPSEKAVIIVCRRQSDALIFARTNGLAEGDWHWICRYDAFKAWVAANITRIVAGAAPLVVVLDTYADMDGGIATEITIRRVTHGIKVVFSGPLDVVEELRGG